MLNWLDRLRSDLSVITSQAAKKHWPGLALEDEAYYNYRFEHVRQVERDARRLITAVGGDEEIVLAAVWIHDRCQPQFEGKNHAALAAEWVRNNLISIGFPPDKVAAVEYAVANHSNRPCSLPVEAREARILWDADKLSRFGALSIVVLLCAIPAFPQTQVSYQWVNQKLALDLISAKELINQFYFEESHRWGLARLEAQKNFIQALKEEMQT